MVTKSKTGAGKGKVKVSKLKLNKETVKDLTGSQLEKVKGGQVARTNAACSDPCPKTKVLCPQETSAATGCGQSTIPGTLY